MNATIDEHEVRSAVSRLADHAATPPLPGAAIVAAGARRRGRRRVGTAGALALAATLAVSVSWSALSQPTKSSTTSGVPMTTNAFTEQLGRQLEQVLPGTSISVKMFADLNPATRHARNDDFSLRITKNGHISDAFFSIRVSPGSSPTGTAGLLCESSSPELTKKSGCVATQLVDGSLVHAQVFSGPGAWTARSGDMGAGSDPLTMVTGDISSGDALAYLKVRGGTTSNESGFTPAMLESALADPRFTAFLADFAAHPEKDPYGPLASLVSTLVASGSVGGHSWTLSFARTVDMAPIPSAGNPSVWHCDYWTTTVDGREELPDESCFATDAPNREMFHSTPDVPMGAKQLHEIDTAGRPTATVGLLLTGIVPDGTANVEVTFDDDTAKLTAKVFTVNGGVPYFAIGKPDSATPTWKLATIHCLDVNGREIGKLYYGSPTFKPKEAARP